MNTEMKLFACVQMNFFDDFIQLTDADASCLSGEMNEQVNDVCTRVSVTIT